ncbi:MAG: hypothetical protein DRI90_13495 [Deltaproteobacteria bacterium]|nr:MAG: hypothetical protein DRI90_13495 [Deltaproteobacteria bacterium]
MAAMGRKARIKVSAVDGKHPFMRGMLTHSLLRKGLSFEEANSVANEVRERLAKEGDTSGQDVELSNGELRKLVLRVVRDICGKQRARELKKGPPAQVPLIVHPEGTVPFSRGLLSQKLVGTGLEPEQAYEVAQELASQLRQRPAQRIEAAELRQLERRIVVERHDESFGKRYDAIDHIDRSNRPIVVLIGGCTGSGKSMLATEIAYRLGIRKIASTDMIREIMRKLLSPDILPAIHASSYSYSAAHTQDDPIVAGFVQQMSRVEVGIAATIRRAIVENFHLIVEGVHVVPPMEVANQFADSALIVPVMLATLDRTVLESRFIRRGKELGGERRAKRYLESLDDIMGIQEFILELADQHDVPVIENVSFDETATNLLRLITDQIHRETHLEDPPA